MDELKTVYALITDIWTMFRRYHGKLNSDEAWEQFIAEGQELCKKQKDRRMEILGRNLFYAIEKYFEEDPK